jgi:hypothetical protein
MRIKRSGVSNKDGRGQGIKWAERSGREALTPHNLSHRLHHVPTTYLTAYIMFTTHLSLLHILHLSLTLPYSLTPSFIQESHFLKIVGTHLDSVQQPTQIRLDFFTFCGYRYTLITLGNCHVKQHWSSKRFCCNRYHRGLVCDLTS